MKAKTYTLAILQSELEYRKLKNNRYSIRSFARDLEIDPGSLAAILRGSRLLSDGALKNVQKALKLNKVQVEMIRRDKLPRKNALEKLRSLTPLEEQCLDEQYHFEVIAEWEHYAVLSLIETNNFKSCFDWIAKRLGTNSERAKEVIDNLVHCKLIGIRDSHYYLTCKNLKTSEDISSLALRNSHKQTLAMALEKIDEIDLHLRDYSSCTLTLDPAKLPEIKEIIRDFRNKLGAYTKEHNPEEVYNLAIQFFPLTNLQKISQETL